MDSTIRIKNQFDIIDGVIYIIEKDNQNTIVLEACDYSTHRDTFGMEEFSEKLDANENCKRVIFPMLYQSIECLYRSIYSLTFLVQDEGKYGLLFYQASLDNFHRKYFYSLSTTSTNFNKIERFDAWFNPDRCVGKYQQLGSKYYNNYIVHRNNYIGIIDSSGREVVLCKYDNIRIEFRMFDEIYYWVYSDNKIGIYSPNVTVQEPVKEILPCDFDKIVPYNQVYKVYKNGRVGIGGRVPCEYDDVELLGEYGEIQLYTQLYKIYDGIYQGVFGHRIEIPCCYEKIELLGTAFKVYNGTYWGIYDNFKYVVPCKYNEIELLGSAFKVYNGAYWGIYDNSKHVIPCNYHKIELLNGKFKVYDGNYWGAFNRNGEIFIQCKYDEIISLGVSFLVSIGNRLGVCSWDGIEIIPCSYEKIEIFDEGENISQDRTVRLSGKTYKVYNEGRCGILSWDGDEIIPCQYNDIKSFDSFYKVFDGTFYGIYNKQGEKIIPCIYERIDHIFDGYIVSSNNSIGIYDKKWQVLLPYDNYDKIDFLGFSYMDYKHTPFTTIIYDNGELKDCDPKLNTFNSNAKLEDFCYRIYKGGKVGLYTHQGGMIPCEYASLNKSIYHYYYHFIQVDNSIHILDNIDRRFRKDVESAKVHYECDEIEVFTDSYWRFRGWRYEKEDRPCTDLFKIKKNGRMGIVYNGYMIPALYDKIEPYLTESNYSYQAYFKVCSNSLWGLFFLGEEVSPCCCNDIEFVKGVILLKRDSSIGFVTKSNKAYFPICDEMKLMEFCYIHNRAEFCVAISQHGKWGIIDNEGEEIIAPKYQAITEWSYYNNREQFVVQMDDKYGVIDIEGNYIIPPTYDIIVKGNKGFYCKDKDELHMINPCTGKHLHNKDTGEKEIKRLVNVTALGYACDELNLLFTYDCNLSNLIDN